MIHTDNLCAFQAKHFWLWLPSHLKLWSNTLAFWSLNERKTSDETSKIIRRLTNVPIIRETRNERSSLVLLVKAVSHYRFVLEAFMKMEQSQIAAHNEIPNSRKKARMYPFWILQFRGVMALDYKRVH